MSTETLDLTFRGEAIPTDAEHVGLLRESNDILADVDALRARMADDGYLFLRGLLQRDQVLAARLQILEAMKADGLLDPERPAADGIVYPGKTLNWAPGYAAGRCPKIQDAIYGPEMMGFFDRFFGEPALHYDYTWFRAKSPGVNTPTQPHYDVVYMGRGETTQACTVWTPFGDVPREMGGLIILEGSHKHQALRETYGAYDVDSSCKVGTQPTWTGFGSYKDDIRPVQAELGGRWLGADYRAGDVLIFTFYTMHAATDNNADTVRLSSDSRYQIARGARDDRWFGEHPIGHGEKAHRELIC